MAQAPVVEKTDGDVPLHGEIVVLAADLIGCPVELYNAKLNAKPMTSETGGIVEWHQDYPFHPHTNFDCLAGVIHLDEEREDAGPLCVIPRSHLSGTKSHQLGEQFVGRCTVKLGTSKTVTLCCSPGTVIFHHCLLAHSSGPKRRPGYRRHLIFGYRAPRMRFRSAARSGAPPAWK